MRTLSDRIRYVLLFEFFGVILVALIGWMATGKPVLDLGVLALMLTGIAVIWNFVFNLAFDRVEFARYRGAPRKLSWRVAHALLFEAGLLIVCVFPIAWWLAMALWPAFLLNAGYSAFFVIYTFCFSWLYDTVFPIAPQPEPQPLET